MDLNRRLVEAIEQSVSSTLHEEEKMLTGFLGIVTYLNKDGGKSFTFVEGPNQSILTNLGMVDAIAVKYKGDFVILLEKGGS